MPPISGEIAYLFRHALLREGAYQLQLPGERARLHVLALQILESLYAQDPEECDFVGSEMAEHARQALLSPESFSPAEVRELTLSEHRWLSQAATAAKKSYRLADAVSCFERLSVHSLSSQEQRAASLGRAGAACAALFRWAEAGSYLERAITIAQTHGLVGLESRLMGELSNIHATLGKRAEMQAAMQRQLKLALQSGDAFALALYHIDSGAAEESAGNLVAAEAGYTAALDLLDRAGRTHFKPKLLGNIANTLRDRGEYHRAEKLYAEAIAGHKLAGDIVALGNDTGNLGSNFRLQGRFDEAVTYYERSIAILKQTPYRSMEGIYWHNLGMTRSAQGRLHEAAEAYAPAAANLAQGYDHGNACLAACHLAAIHERQGNNAEARCNIEAAHHMWREAGLTDCDVRAAAALLEERQRWPK